MVTLFANFRDKFLVDQPNALNRKQDPSLGSQISLKAKSPHGHRRSASNIEINFPENASANNQ